MENFIIDINNVSKRYDDHLVLDQISLSVRDGEFLTLLGPSGCGKTTLLRLLSGFERPDVGAVLMDGVDVTRVPAAQRNVHTVFQHYALFPHMTVFDNIAFGLRVRGLPAREIETRVDEMLLLVKLQGLSGRYPKQLSGGQQQRVAIARAAVNEPLVLLLDEPLSSLDYRLRKAMQIELRHLQKRLGITFIFVTHDQEEALSLSDRIVVMMDGKIAQIGTPREVYESPNSLKVAQFVGELNIFNTMVIQADPDKLHIKLENHILTLPNKQNFQAGDDVHILVRPEDIRVWQHDKVDNTSPMLPGKVEEVIYKGSTVDLIVHLHSGQRIAASEFFDEDDAKLEYKIGEPVWLHWLPGWESILPYEKAE